jgi:hypothetical protein
MGLDDNSSVIEKTATMRGWLVGELGGSSVGWLVSWVVGWVVGWWLVLLVGELGCWFGWLVS